MKAAPLILIGILVATGCNRRLSVTNSQNYHHSDSSTYFIDSSKIHIKERELKITRYGDQLTGNITIPESVLNTIGRIPVFADSLESAGIKLNTTVTRDSTGNLKIRLHATAKPVTVQDLKEKHYTDKKAIAGETDIKTTNLQTDFNKQVSSTSVPWLIWLLLLIAIVLFIKNVLKVF